MNNALFKDFSVAAVCGVCILWLQTGLAQTVRFNDTGLTSCVYPNGSRTEYCADSGQDAAYGRDFRNQGDGDGLAGFRFRKLDATGRTLPQHSEIWACVHDVVTNLTWEEKTSDSGPHDVNRTFNQVLSADGTQTEQFARATSAEGLCGYRDWRVPTKDEGETLMTFGDRSQEQQRFFKFLGRTWTSTCARQSLDGSCGLMSVGMDNYVVDWIYEFNSVRLVRGPKLITDGRFQLIESEAYDRRAGTTWARCVIGQRWNGVTCDGNGVLLTIEEAILYAKGEEQRTGIHWRLPNIKELMSISIHPPKTGGSPIDLTVFPNAPIDRTWSNTSSATYLFWSYDFRYLSQSVYFIRGEKRVAYVRLAH